MDIHLGKDTHMYINAWSINKQ